RIRHDHRRHLHRQVACPWPAAEGARRPPVVTDKPTASLFGVAVMSANSNSKGPGQCPTHEQLFAFSVGTLPAELREAIASHIEGCAACLDALRTLDDNADPVIAAARKPIPPELFSGAAGQNASPFATVDSPPPAADGIPGSEETPPPLPERLGDYRIEAVLGS